MHNYQHKSIPQPNPFNTHNQTQESPFHSLLPFNNQDPQACLNIIQQFHPNQIAQMNQKPQPEHQGLYSIPYLPTNLHHYINPQRNTYINPQSQQSLQAHTKMNHIDDLNKSVKSIMKCNEQYREQLLSAYQNKSKVSIQNVILTKQKQNLIAEKSTLQAELLQATNKLAISEEYNKRSQQNHKKVCAQLRKEIQILQEKLSSSNNLKYQLNNKCNQNLLFAERIRVNEIVLRQSAAQIQKLQQQKMTFLSNIQLLKKQLHQLKSEKEHLYTSNRTFQQKLQGNHHDLQQQKERSSHLHKQLNYLQYQFNNLSKKYQHQKQLSLEAQKQLYNSSKKIEQLQASLRDNTTKYLQICSKLTNKQSEMFLMKAELSELSSAKYLSMTLSESLYKKEKQVHQLLNLNSQLSSQYNQINFQYNQLKYRHTEMQNTRQCYQREIQTLNSSYAYQIDKLKHLLQQQSLQKQRLNNVVSKKEELIQEKEKQICQQINQIVSLQSNITKQNNQFSKQISNKEISMTQFQHKINQLKVSITQYAENITEKQNCINNLKKQLQSTKQAKEKIIANMGSQMEQAKTVNKIEVEKLHSIIQRLKQQIAQLQQKLNASRQANKQKQGIIREFKSQIQKETQLNYQLNGQKEIIKAQKQKIEQIIKDKTKKQKQMEINLEGYKRQIEQNIKVVKKQNIEIEKLKAKNEILQQQVYQLGYQINCFKSNIHKQKMKVQTLHSLNKQILNLQEIANQLQVDPKICISRFTSLVNSAHRQPFTRETERLKAYLAKIGHLSKQLKSAVQLLRFNSNALNFQFTFSPKKRSMSMNSNSEK